jgi:hypothetical protein
MCKRLELEVGDLSCSHAVSQGRAKMGRNRNAPRPVSLTYQCSLGLSFQREGDRNLGMWKFVPVIPGPKGSLTSQKFQAHSLPPLSPVATRTTTAMGLTGSGQPSLGE